LLGHNGARAITPAGGSGPGNVLHPRRSELLTPCRRWMRCTENQRRCPAPVSAPLTNLGEGASMDTPDPHHPRPSRPLGSAITPQEVAAALARSRRISHAAARALANARELLRRLDVAQRG
jgi:hypothetical protein